MQEAELLETARAEGITRFVVGALVMKGPTVLLLRRKASDFMGGIYELPSGEVEHHETLGSALLREVKEETGLELARKDRFVGSIDYPSKIGEPTRQFNFGVTVRRYSRIRLAEHDDYAWVDKSQLGQLPMSDETRVYVVKTSGTKGEPLKRATWTLTGSGSSQICQPPFS